MTEKPIIDYCKIGKGKRSFALMGRSGVKVCSMICLGPKRCNSCRNQFCADVTYDGETFPVEERTLGDFVRRVRELTEVDLTPYTGLRD